jgi:branched-chain amino acid transport system ATP-binding protein
MSADLEPQPSRPDVLAVEEVSVAFGGVNALQSVSFGVSAGELCGLIGPNGAGKTTLFNVISGFQRADSGRVSFQGAPLGNTRIDKRCRSGIVRTFQETELFDDLTVAENVAVAMRAGRPADVDELLEITGLTPWARTLCSDLPAGRRRIVGVARAVACRPILLLLDEPGAGLIHDEVQELAAMLHDVRARLGCAVLLVDHDLSLIRLVCSRLLVLDFGSLIADGPPELIENDKKVRSAYLGL